MRFLYILLAYLLVPFLLGTMLWRGLRDREYWSNLHERFGFGKHQRGLRSIWVHAVSVGEVNAAAALVRALRLRYPNKPLVLTTVTPTGAQLARSLFPDSVNVRYVPYDLPGSVRRFFDNTNPEVAIILETELWPNLYYECGRRRVPLILASARISPRSVTRYRRLVPLFRDALSHGIVVAAQTASDAERFVSIGLNPARAHVTGNIKFDFELPESVQSGGVALRRQHAAGRSVWIAGSTHEGEETMVLDAHRRVRQRHPDALLILVPRHRNRFESVAQMLKRRGFAHVTRSSGVSATAQTEVLLVDTLGELLSFYAMADVAFVGGSLVPIGGHNLLEPAALALPILTGPNNFNSEDIAKLLMDVGAAFEVGNVDDLSGQVGQLLADPQTRAEIGARARQAVDENRGALHRLLELISPLLQES